jgi:hypothetical protein
MIQIENSNIKSSDVSVVGSRYRGSDVVYYGEQRYLTFTTYRRLPYVASGLEKIMLITKGIEYRPDLVAYDRYGFQGHWWRILEVNGMKDIWDFKAGTTIFLPDIV